MPYFGWKPYVPVAQRRAAAERKMQQLAKKGQVIEPVTIKGRRIARTFWGEAWCNHLERFSDYANRLPRGRSYARNGSICHLAVRRGTIQAIVSGSELYNIKIAIKPLPAAKWQSVREHCAGRIGSMLELLQGKLSSQVMEIVTHQDHGLFPSPREIQMQCSCPDWAGLCKHLAAVLYGVGARLDQQPELLFELRGVDHQELISADLDLTSSGTASGKRRRIADDQLAGIFGVDIDAESAPVRDPRAAARQTRAAHRGAPQEVTREATVRRRPAKQTDTGKASGSAAARSSAAKPFVPTAEAISELRRSLAVTKSQFAALIGVSPPTVGNWEKRKGLLVPRPAVLDALSALAARAAEGTRKNNAGRTRKA